MGTTPKNDAEKGSVIRMVNEREYVIATGRGFMPFVRTVEDFVEDMVSDCKTWKQICMVVQSTRWVNHKVAVSAVYRSLRRRQKDILNRNRKGKGK